MNAQEMRAPGEDTRVAKNLVRSAEKLEDIRIFGRFLPGKD